MKVPDGKTLYIGGRRFKGGDILPFSIAIKMNFEDEEKEIKIEKPKRKYTRKKK